VSRGEDTASIGFSGRASLDQAASPQQGGRDARLLYHASVGYDVVGIEVAFHISIVAAGGCAVTEICMNRLGRVIVAAVPVLLAIVGILMLPVVC
jgi:hypothetical protein